MCEILVSGNKFMAARKRVLIIGLDGFTWQVGNRLMAEGIMPFLGKLVADGCHGNLQSVMPFETSPAWSSFQTGCYPGKTEVFAFHAYDRQQNTLSLNSFANNQMPSIWELADRKGKTVVSLNMPVSSPPPKVNGIIIPGLLCPKLTRQTVHPPEAFDKYIKPNKEYLIVNNDWQETVAETIKQGIITEKARCKTALELIKDVDWDIFSVQVQSTDLMQHRAWHAIEPTAKGYTQQDNAEAMEFFKECDRSLEKIVAAAGEETLVLVVSDHGFGTSKYAVALNVWLKEHGYLKLLPDKEPCLWVRLKQKVHPLKLLAMLYGNIKKCFRKSGSTPVFGVIDLEHMRQVIDFDNTQALCVGGMAGILYITEKDKDKRKALAEKICQEMLDELGPDSVKPVIKNIKPGAEVYSMDTECIPDLVIEYFEGVESRRNPKGQDVVVTREKDGIEKGTHRRDGVWVACGKDVKTGINSDKQIVDIIPTVLAYLGLEIPKHIDGETLSEIFKDPLELKYEDFEFDRSKMIQYTNDEQAEVEKQLADLGYL